MEDETVALLAEGVDRNESQQKNKDSFISVALLAEGVDRNCPSSCGRCYLRVALLAEGVDRNASHRQRLFGAYRSPSSRRAWIEISNRVSKQPECRSPSSRRAWIEI